MYYAHWDAYSLETATEYEKAAQELSDQVGMVSMIHIERYSFHATFFLTLIVSQVFVQLSSKFWGFSDVIFVESVQ